MYRHSDVCMQNVCAVLYMYLHLMVTFMSTWPAPSNIYRRTLTYVAPTYVDPDLPYILESNAHPFYSFRGLKNQMRIRFACGLDSRSRAGFWKND
jgi:hypothetical protein